MDSSNLNYKIASAAATNKKYIIEGDGDEVEDENIEYDFFTKLKCMMSETQCVGGGDSGVNDDSDNICLLTKEPLHDIHIVLSCGHKFNYIPLYKEVVIQKTSAGMTTNGYYNLCLLRTNELKCPYCRRVQDKLLPLLNYSNIKKLRGVNAPESLCMKVRTCEHVETANKKKKKNAKKEMSSACKCNAIHVVNGTYYCKKHYEQQLQEKEQPQQQQEKKEEIKPNFESENANMCGVLIKTGKKKGLPCTSSSSCRIHAHLRKNVVVATSLD